jgi:hypothetical protein
MGVTIRRRLRRSTEHFTPATYIDLAQILLQRGLNVGFTMNELLEPLSEIQQAFTLQIIVTNEFDTIASFAKSQGTSNGRAGHIGKEVYVKLKVFMKKKFLFPFGRRNFQNIYEETEYRNPIGEPFILRRIDTVAEQVDQIEKDIFLRPNDEIFELIEITKKIQLDLQ